MAYLMGIDLGTSGVKVMIMSECGNMSHVCSKSYNVIISRQGYAEQNPEELWKTTCKTIRECVYQSGINGNDICSIGLSGQMHGLLLLDKEGNPVRDMIIWMDQRSCKEAEIINELEMGHNTLNRASSGFYGPSLLWLRKYEQKNYEKAYKAVLPKDFIRYRMCNEIGTDETDAAGTALYDLRNKKWSETLIKELEIKQSLLPDVYYCAEIAGKITASCAKMTGLKKGTPVVYGGGDQAMHTLGNGMIEPGIMSVNIGTAGQLSVVTDIPLYDKKFRTNTFCHVYPEYWSLVGATLNGGAALKWLKDNVLKYGGYKEMDERAGSIAAGSDGLIFLPYLCGERTPHMNSRAKGMFFGLHAGMNDAHMIRSVMEGVVFSLKDCMTVFSEMGIDSEYIISSGGGSRSRLWLQMQADILEKEIYLTKTEEEACTGSIIVAGTGAGIYTDLKEAVQLLVKTDNNPVVPDKNNRSIYQSNYNLYQKLYVRNRELMDCF